MESKVQEIPLEAVSDRAAKTGADLSVLLPTEESSQKLKRIDLKLDLALSEVNTLLSEIREALKQEDIGVPFPQRDLHILNRNKDKIPDLAKEIPLPLNLTPASNSDK